MAAPIVQWRPDPSGSYILAHEALAYYLDIIQFKMDNLVNGTCVIGENLFIDMLPKEYYDDNAGYGDSPDVLLVLLENEPIGFPLLGSRFVDKVDTLVRINVKGGNRSRVNSAVRRLYAFFLQRENVSGWTACGLTVESVVAIQEPIFVGVEDTGLNTYQFRVQVRAVRTDLGV